MTNSYGFVPSADRNNEHMHNNMEGINPNMNMTPMMINQMNQMMMSQMISSNGDYSK